MRVVSKVVSRMQRAIMVTILAGTALVPVAGIFAPATVSAAACAISGGGGGGGGLLNLGSYNGGVDAAINKVGIEVTPDHTWGTHTYDNVSGGFGYFADASCAKVNSYVYYTIDDAKKLIVNFVDNDRTGAFVDTVDYNAVYSGVTFTSSSNTSGALNYTLPSFAQDEAVLVSVDISTAGKVEIYLKIGSGSENKLGDFLANANTDSFLTVNSIGQSVSYGFFDDFGDCSGFTGAAAVDVRMLAGGSPVDLTEASGGTCSSFAHNSYNASTKTVTLGFQVAGAAVNHTVDLISGSGSIKSPTVDQLIYAMSSLNLTTDGKWFKDSFTSGSNTSQQLYFGVTESVDGKKLPKNNPWPIAGGVFDMSSDVDLSAVSFDTSPDGYAALAHKLNEKTKDGSFTLFVPYRDGDKFVGVCPGAATIAAVTSKCTGIYYVKEGQTKTSKDTKSIPANRSVKASIVTVGTKKFWQVDGLTGTGVLSANIASDPDTGISVSVTSTPFAVGAMILTLGAAILARRSFAKK